ncbi:helicase-exonuclease AddAB subunit AddA [Staphylococcus muscae]|uniref:ATP-dependent helicase/nuclease subunit A n=1 Tax=Staphylococcus muscae TaxID=1294 RepID=A0A240C150_9STAP|nr:helicase-exonuclease AddAB subunit AddA [Staphylococcus muscae]AVQ34500.1 helicase-exonuclease AddAB subunit AddA [Staphylococcus muscae]PNZ03583.1 helicase-exonuclease AddAB subunit AddA [Staphylococcus muscae]GGA91157.1 ATP-dependent helicase/nuclease subunit A [Staphylococcus muscae]SNW01053.1 exonuclease RexA [Staphylococcus muscae]
MIPTKPKDVQWTDAQWESIYAKDQDILVAAAAGSGKTAVLVERIIQRILRDDIDVDRLLVVTFTNASAREMRHRIEASIQKASIENPTNQHLKNQRAKIHQAHISTLHSFCLKLIQQHYDQIELDPNFRTASEVENVLLLNQAIDDVFEDHYKRLDPQFITLTEHLSSDRSDESLREIVKKMYYFSIANPQPFVWLNALDKPYRDNNAQQHYIEILDEYIQLYLEAAQDTLDQLYEQLELIGFCEEHIDLINKHRDFFRQLLSEAIIDQDKIRSFKYGRMPNRPAEVKEDPQLADAYKFFEKTFKRYKSYVERVKQFVGRDRQTLQQELTDLAPRVAYLAELTKDVIQKFELEKRARNIVDFADYEHMALRILLNEDGTPSEIADAYREQFDEILVDEYQDTNRVQEAIISSIKRGNESNGNLFMVGDVKQSIYKFRQADPSLFIEKYERFNQPEQSSGKRIDLSQNFRSRKEVLATTNYLFKHMMDPAIGEIDYDEAASLYDGASFDDMTHPVHLTTLLKDSSLDLNKGEQEAALIAQQVERILETQKVYDFDSKDYRPATYKDIVVLESNTSNLRNIQQVFKDRNIPFYAKSKDGYFEQTEVRLMLSFLRTIDNPLQDIYLVGLMRSVIYQFTEAELAQIRVVAPNEDYFYQTMQQYLEADDVSSELQQKVRRFLQDLNVYRRYSQSHPVYQLIDKLFNDHYIPQYFSGLVGGEGRRANLHGLFNKAIEFDNSSYRGLFQFIRFIDEMIDRDQDFGEENVIGPNDDVVRWMTVHSSKGLEFPFVIYSGLSREFNKTDLQKPVMLNQYEGLGLQYYDTEHSLFYPSLISMSIELINQKELISERMRLIYVALTRAKEQLYLIGTVDDTDVLEQLTAWSVTDNRLGTIQRFTAKSAFELIYSVLSKHKATHLLPKQRFSQTIDELPNYLQPTVKIQHVEAQDIISIDDEISDAKTPSVTLLNERLKNADMTSKEAEEIKERLLFEYPHQVAVTHPSKQSVSELKRQLETEQADTNYERVRQYRLGAVTYERPIFMQEQQRNAAEVGTLMHTVMQHLPFKEERLTEPELYAYIDRLVAQAIIDEEAIQDINIEEVKRFVDSDLYLRIAKSDSIYRELPFIVNQNAVESKDREDAIIQGMIDLVFEEDGHYYFVDYKTDVFVRRRGMTDEELGLQLKEKYRIQMKYYQQALEVILKQKVSGSLYFFKFGEITI